MQKWEAKKVGVTRPRYFVLPKDLRDEGVTIAPTPAPTASAVVYEGSRAQDNSPNSIISTQPNVISTQSMIEYELLAPYQAVEFDMTGGVLDATYVVTIALTRSDGKPFSEDILQYISRHEPVP